MVQKFTHKNNQSNFGTGMEYEIIIDDVCMLMWMEDERYD